MTPKEFFEDSLTNRFSSDPEKTKAVGAIYQFDITGDDGGTWTLDFPEAKVVTGPADNAQCTITVSDSDFVDIIGKKLNAQMAFLQGRLKISGDMSLALKLGQVLSA